MMPQQQVKVSTKLCPKCHFNFILCQEKQLFDLFIAFGLISSNSLVQTAIFIKNSLDKQFFLYIINFTTMARPKPKKTDESKVAVLRENGALHPRPDVVKDEAFRGPDFFDARDLVQVRYEMLRRHRVDGGSVTEVAASFGVSRQAFYRTHAAFEEQGIPGLLPRRRGPKRAHKCTEEILDFAEQWRSTRTGDDFHSVAEAVQERFGVSINPRSIERALARRKKKRPGKRRTQK
jgi:transposase